MMAAITDADLQAYLDDQLDTSGRIEVERWLQDHPDAAAEVMAGLGQRDEIRLFLAEETWPPAPATVSLVRELQRRLGRRSVGLRVRRGLAAAVLIAAGWWAHAEYNLVVAAAHPVPAFADAAADAWGALQPKLAAGHDPGATILPGRRSSEEVPLPALGSGLRVLGSDTMPWNGGTATVVLYRTETDRALCLFAVDAGSFAVAAPQAAILRGRPTVYWQIGPVAYALNGNLPEADLLAIARSAAPPPWAGFHLYPSTEGATHG